MILKIKETGKLQKGKKKKIQEKVPQDLQELHSKVRQFQIHGLSVAELPFAENKYSKRTTKSPIQNRNWLEKKTGAK